MLQQLPSSPLTLCLLLFVFLFFVFKLITPSATTKYKLPPSPTKLPLIGNLHQLHGSELHRALWSLSQKYGPLMLLHMGRVPTLVVSSANMAEQVLKTSDSVFSSRPQTLIPKRLLYEKDMAFAPYGEYWRQVRKVCVLELLSVKKVNSFGFVREEEVALMMDKIQESSHLNLEVNMTEMLMSLTNNLICRVALGRKYNDNEDGRKFNQILREFTCLLGVFNVGDLVPSLAWVNHFTGLNTRVEKNFREIDSFLDQVIQEHAAETKRRGSQALEKEEDFVDLLLQTEKDSNLGIPFGRDSTKAIIMDMFAAGTDTTSTVPEWAMSELVKNPAVMKEVQAEVRGVAQGKMILKENDTQEMHYLKAVIKETLRLHPPAPLLVPRESMTHVKLQDYDIPAKTRVMVSAFAIGREPSRWEQPEKFWPKRFMTGNNAVLDFKGNDFDFIPFGAGRRGCPGIQFAISVIEVSLANLLNRFDWALPNAMDGNDLDMDEDFGLTVHKKKALLLAPQIPEASRIRAVP